MNVKLFAVVAVAIGTMAAASTASAREVCGAPSGLNFRTHASLHAPVKTVLANGSDFKTLGRSPGGQWLKVSVNGRQGWVSARYACADRDDSNRRAALRSNPGAGGGNWRSPVPGICVTSPYGRRILRGRVDYHPGLDLGAPCGTRVHSAAPGRVIYAGWLGGYGNAVEIQHPNGFVTIYGHNSRISVRPGQSVNQSTQIARSGNTGNSTGCHVHFEVRRGARGGTLDPRSLIGYSSCPRTGRATGFGGRTLNR